MLRVFFELIRRFLTRNNRPMRLQQVPSVAQQKILTSCDPVSLLQLALCSKRMQNLVRGMDVTVSVFARLTSEVYGIVICSPESCRHLDIVLDETKEGECLDGALLAARCKRVSERVMSCDAVSSLQNTAALYAWLVGLFSPKQLGWHLNLDAWDQQQIGQLVLTPFFASSFVVFVEGKLIESESLRLLIDNLLTASNFNVQTGVPLHFDHPNPFRFTHTIYADARWARTEHLLSMNLSTLLLESTSFGSSDINAFLKKWLETDLEMVRDLTLYLSSKIDLDVVLAGIQTLKFYSNDRKAPFLLITSRREVRREGQLGTIGHNGDRTFRFTTKRDERFPGKKALLRLVQRKADLEVEEDVVRQQIQNFEWNSENDGTRMERFRELENRKTSIRNELRQVEWELQKERVDFSTGRAVIRS